MWGRNQINIREPVQKCVCTQPFLSIASARRDERISRESRPGDETRLTFAGVVQVLNDGLSLVRLHAYEKCSRED